MFRAVYSILILGAFLWMIEAYGATPVMAVWQPPPALAWVPILVMPLALLLVVVHLTVLGWRGWLAPQGWNGGLPPISMVAVVAALIPLLVKRKLIHDKRERALAHRDSEE